MTGCHLHALVTQTAPSAAESGTNSQIQMSHQQSVQNKVLQESRLPCNAPHQRTERTGWLICRQSVMPFRRRVSKTALASWTSAWKRHRGSTREMGAGQAAWPPGEPGIMSVLQHNMESFLLYAPACAPQRACRNATTKTRQVHCMTALDMCPSLHWCP